MLLELRLLGGFSVRVEAREIPAAAWAQRRAAEVVKLLALAPGRRLAREQVMDSLWPGLEPAASAANLHKAAHYARAALGVKDAIVLRGGSVALGPDGDVVIDAQEFDRAAEAALSARSPSACRTAAALYTGELLPDDRYAEGATRPRERLRHRHLDVLRGAGLWERLLTEEPGDEQAHRELMRAHAAAGDRQAALRQHRRLIESGTRPSEQTEALCEELLQGPAAVAPVVAASPLVGREPELRRAQAAWLGAARGRGSTLLVRGDAGIGKTRLAEELLRKAADAGWSTLRGTAHEDHAGLPFAPVTEALDRLLQERPELALAVSERARAGLLTQLTGRHLSRETLDAVYSLAGGNPFFTEELASSAAADEPLEVPSQLLDVVEGRLARLPRTVRSALEAVAVVTGEPDARELQVLCELPEREAFVVLDHALAAGVLVEGEGRWRFRHGLLRAALVRGLPAHRRAAAHRDAAERLAKSGAPAAAVAYQLLEAGLGARAAPWLVRAARNAARMGAYSDAHRLAARALEFMPDDVEAIELRADLAVALGDPDAAAAYSPALANLTGEHAGDVRVKQAYAYFIGGDLPRAAQVLARVGRVRAPSRARLLITRGWLAVFGGDFAGATDAAIEARALAGELGLTAELFEASMLEAFVTLNRGEWPERLRSDLLDPTRAPEVAGMLHEAHLCVSQVFLYGGLPYEEVIAGARGLAAAAERAGARRGIAFATTLLGEAELLSGHLDRAEAHLSDGVRCNREVAAHGGEALCLWRLAELALLRDEREDAVSLLERAYTAASPSSLCVPHVLCRVHGGLIRAAPDSGGGGGRGRGRGDCDGHAIRMVQRVQPALPASCRTSARPSRGARPSAALRRAGGGGDLGAVGRARLLARGARRSTGGRGSSGRRGGRRP